MDAKYRCPRCGRRHKIDVAALTKPCGEFPLWGLCGRTSEPIFARQVAVGEPRCGRRVKADAKPEWEFI